MASANESMHPSIPLMPITGDIVDQLKAYKHLMSICVFHTIHAGDIVAVELLPESEWRRPSSRLPGQGKAGTSTGTENEEEDADGGEDEEGAEAVPELFQVRVCVLLCVYTKM